MIWGRIATPMKLISVCRGLSVLLVVVLSGLTSARGQVNDGFLGNPWGTSFARMQQRFGLKLTLQRGWTQQYRANVNRVDGIELASCDFEFTSGKLSGVILLTGDITNSRRLFDLLRRTYGEGREVDILGYQWFSERTHAAYDEARDGDAYVYLYCMTLAGM